MSNFSIIPDVLSASESNITHEQTIFWKFSDLYHPLHGWLSSIVCIFGILSNFLNIIVLTRRNMVNKHFEIIFILSNLWNNFCCCKDIF